jgi:serine/threonine protein kinase
MKTCPQCEVGYSDRCVTCPVHGTILGEVRDFKPGMVIHKTYKIVRKLGQGGMGAVYLARHILMDEPRALKFLSPELSANKDFTNRFLREVRSLRQVRNLNVIDCGDLESAEDDSIFFAMEFVDGPDLGSFLRNAPQPFDVALALSLTQSISEGLGAAHAKGLVHRDIKPENILLARDGECWVPKIADFGIVATRELSTYTQTGSLLLTPYYAAPEQWRGMRASELDCRTDIYALGGVLYEMLTGQKALNAHDYHGWAHQHLTVEPQPPSCLRSDLADWKGLDALVLRMLAKDREQRPKNVTELQSLIEPIAHTPPPKGCRVAEGDSALEREPPVSKNGSIHLAVWAWVASIAVVLILISTVPRFLRLRLSTPRNETPSHRVPPADAPNSSAGLAPRTEPPAGPKTGHDTRVEGLKPDPHIKQEKVAAQSASAGPQVQEPKAVQKPKTARVDEPPATAPILDASQQPNSAPVEAPKLHVRETSIYDINESAKKLFDSGAYSEAKPLFEQACNGGSGEACNYLGTIFSKGEGVKIDNTQAVEFFSLACNAGEATACSELGYIYLNGLGVPVDYTRAFNFSSKGCDAGSIVGCENLGLLYARGAGVARDDQRAVALYSKACDAGVSRGCSNLGQMVLQGRGINKDVSKGKDLLKKGCSMGDRRGCDWVRETR